MFQEALIECATVDDATDIIALQKLAYQSEARLYDDWSLPPLTQTVQEFCLEFDRLLVLKACVGGKIVGSVRASLRNETCHIGRLIVHPQHQRRGIGRQLMSSIEAKFASATAFELFTGSRSATNIRFYERLGFSTFQTSELSPAITLVFMKKIVQRPPSCVVTGTTSTDGAGGPVLHGSG